MSHTSTPSASLPPTSVEDALRLVDEAGQADRAQLQRLQLERFHALLAYAREHSPLLREKYAKLSATPALEEVPPFLRSEGMTRYDDWLCDRQAGYESLTRFLEDQSDLLKLYLDKYRLLTTSGTTSEPLRMLRDAGHVAVNAALMYKRFFGSSKVAGLPDLNDPSLRCCGIFMAGIHSGYVSMLRMQKAFAAQGYPDNGKFFAMNSPAEELIANLNTFQPQILATYPSTMYSLARYQQAGRLQIKPLVICCSAETLPRDNMLLAEKVFGCKVLDNYCSTEGGEIAMMCRENRMHVNMDWIIVEPVDADKKPVPPGTMSEGTLITNLANLIQPIIRYYVSDRVTMREETCPCGSHLPYMEIEGRTDDVLELEGNDGLIFFSPLHMAEMSLHIQECVECQLIRISPSEVEIRFTSMNKAGRQALGETIREQVRKLLGENGSRVNIRVGEAPVIRGKSGKLRLTIPDLK